MIDLCKMGEDKDSLKAITQKHTDTHKYLHIYCTQRSGNTSESAQYT